jgi:hypothetical protein
MDSTDIENRFNYHPPQSDEVAQRHEGARDLHRDLADWINENLPDSREKSLAITKLEESMFWTNAGIARMTLEGARR